MTFAPTAVTVAAETSGDPLAAHYRRIGIPAVSAAAALTKLARSKAPAKPAHRPIEEFVD